MRHRLFPRGVLNKVLYSEAPPRGLFYTKKREVQRPDWKADHNNVTYIQCFFITSFSAGHTSLLQVYRCYWIYDKNYNITGIPFWAQKVPLSYTCNWKMLPLSHTYNLGQNCWENCIFGQHFSKHRSCAGSSLSPFPWKQCCCVFKRKPDPWVLVGSNIELGERVFFPQRCRFRNSFVA